MYARKFGWHPGIVDDLSLSADVWLIPLNDAIDADLVRRQNEAEKKARNKRQ